MLECWYIHVISGAHIYVVAQKVNCTRILTHISGGGGAYGSLPLIMTAFHSLVSAVQVDSTYSPFMDCKLSTISRCTELII